MPLSRQIRSNRTLRGVGPEPSGEHLAVVGQDLIGDPPAAEGGGEDLADRFRDRPAHEPCRHAEPAVVVDPGEDLQLGAVVEEHPSHHVHLPHLHGTLPLEAAVLVSPPTSAAELDQPVALEAAVDRGAGGHGVNAGFGELVLDPPGTPPGMLPSHLADEGFGLGERRVGTALGPVRAIGEGGEPSLLVAGDPVVHALAGHSQAAGDLDHLPPVLNHRQHCLVPLLHDAQLHKHGRPPPRRIPTRRDHPGRLSSISRSHRQRSGGTGVKHHPEPCPRSGDAGMSSITRSTTPGSAPGRNRTSDTRFRKPVLYPLSYEGPAQV